MVLVGKLSGYTDRFHGLFAFLLRSCSLHDIDVLIQVKDSDVLALRHKLSELNKHFALAGVGLYYVDVSRLSLTKED